MVYVAPMKALVQEMVTKFSKRLSKMAIVVKELTGDMQLTKVWIYKLDIVNNAA